MIKVFELEAGCGGWSFGLQEAGIEYENVGYSEIDKFAIQCYEQNHKGENYGDCTKIFPEELPDFDLLCASPPCQSFSVAGKGKGCDDPRGRLFENNINIMKVKQPRWAIYENVKGLVSKKHSEYFNYIIWLMKSAGYYVCWKVLNTKDYGIPQNRERVFIVCFREYEDYRQFYFPGKEKLKIFLKDILEEEVDEKYYLSESHVNRLVKSTDVEKGFSKINPDVAGTQTSRQHANWKGNFVLGNVNPSGKGVNGNVHAGYVGPTITTNKGEGAKVAIPVLTPDRIEKRQNGRRFKEDGEPMFTLNTQDRHGIMQLNNPKHSNNRVYDSEGCSPALRDMSQGGGRQPFIVHNCLTEAIGRAGSSKEYLNSCNKVFESSLQIRKLTPTECFRLQGFLRDQINLEGISNSQRYKIAGNGLSINVIEKLFRRIFNGN